MKRVLFTLFAVVAIATACKKEELKSSTIQDSNITINFTATLDAETRTVFNPLDKSVSWGADEKIKVLQTIDGVSTIAESSTAVVNDARASFAVEFPSAEATSYSYTAVCPASACWNGEANIKPESWQFGLPTVQKPSATSFDPKADILVAKPITVNAQASNMELQFARIVALGQMEIKGLATGANISVVKIRAVDQKLTNWMNYDTATLENNKFFSKCEHVILDYGAAGLAPGEKVYFTTWPFSFAETGGKLIVEVTTQDDNYYKKEITLDAATTFRMEANKMTTFSVDMSDPALRQENTKRLMFNFNVNPGGWPEDKGVFVEGGVTANYYLAGQNYPFLLEVCTMNASGKNDKIVQSIYYRPAGSDRDLLINSARYLGLPIIEGYVLTQIDFIQKAGPPSSGSRTAMITADRYQEGKAVPVVGGEAISGLAADTYYSFSLNDEAILSSTRCFLACTAKGMSVSDIDLTYVKK